MADNVRRGFRSSLLAGEAASDFSRVVEPEEEEGDVYSLRTDAESLDRKLKKNVGGYTKASVEEYVAMLNRSAEQMQSSLEKQIKSLSEECSKLSGEGMLLRRQMAKADEEKDMAGSGLSAAVNAKNEAERKLENAENEIEKLRSRITLLESAAPETEDSGRLQELAEQCAQQEEMLQSAVTELENAHMEIRSLKASLAERASSGDGGFSASEKSEMEASYSKLYEMYKEASDGYENLLTEKEVLSELVAQYQAKEKEYVLLRKRGEEQRRVIEEQRRAGEEMVAEMERQLALFKELSEERRANKETIYKLTREKSELQMQNVNMREKLETLSRQYMMLEQESMKLSRQIISQTGVPAEEKQEAPAPEQEEIIMPDNELSFAEVMRKVREISQNYRQSDEKDKEKDVKTAASGY